MILQTLKERFKPPFRFIYYPPSILVDNNDKDLIELITTPFSPFDSNRDLFNAFKDFIIEAMIEKWERDFKKPLRCGVIETNYSNSRITKEAFCQKCEHELIYLYIKDINYCPHCGQRIDPPKEE